ncbi:methionine ABC transporter permease [Bifidobacterium sp. SO4]|uniref:methionine ABC transporter permease n=1 Tax=Bifidobacterium sp. SO4 TaxID=2809030 RepID=UPI001BDC7775|nr:ABC transporter permease [Bifidobacterium sp. SO4]
MSEQPWDKIINDVMLPALGSTAYMVIIATILSSIIGLALAIVLVVTAPGGLHPNQIAYRTLDIIVNILRSFPFIILAVAIIPLTRLIVGTSIGEEAALVPLVAVGAPFTARLFEGSLKAVDHDLIVAASSFGASTLQVIGRVMIPEAIPAIILNVTLATISILGLTAMAGAIGAGGLGAVAITYGYQNFNDAIMYGTVIVLVVLVQLIQLIGNLIYRKLK